MTAGMVLVTCIAWAEPASSPVVASKMATVAVKGPVPVETVEAVTPPAVEPVDLVVAPPHEPEQPPVDASPPTTEVPPPPPEPEPQLHPAMTGTVRERALARLAELGATPWMLTVFDCIGRHESGWQSIRSHRANPNGTFDHGPFQLNDVHWPTLNGAGLDPYVPEDAATFAWSLSRNGTRFSPTWTVASRCGV